MSQRLIETHTKKYKLWQQGTANVSWLIINSTNQKTSISSAIIKSKKV